VSGWMPDTEQAREESNLLPSVLETEASTTGSSPGARATEARVSERQAAGKLSETAELPAPEAHAGIGGFRMPRLIPSYESADGGVRIRAETRQGGALELFLGVVDPCHRTRDCEGSLTGCQEGNQVPLDVAAALARLYGTSLEDAAFANRER
jgi:hypothetical protein